MNSNFDNELLKYVNTFEPNIAHLKRQEILKYATISDKTNGVLPINHEKKLCKEAFQNLYIKELDRHDIPTPSETFMEKTNGIKCINCGEYDVIHMAIQLRSSDEPTDDVYTCNSCGYKWKHIN